jgi:hypothetical protein
MLGGCCSYYITVAPLIFLFCTNLVVYIFTRVLIWCVVLAEIESNRHHLDINILSFLKTNQLQHLYFDSTQCHPFQIQIIYDILAESCHFFPDLARFWVRDNASRASWIPVSIHRSEHPKCAQGPSKSHKPRPPVFPRYWTSFNLSLPSRSCGSLGDRPGRGTTRHA